VCSTPLFVKTQITKKKKRTPRSVSECLWMMRSISTLITGKTLHCTAVHHQSHQHKIKDHQPSTLRTRVSIVAGFAVFACVIKLPKPCPGSEKIRRIPIQNLFSQYVNPLYPHYDSDPQGCDYSSRATSYSTKLYILLTFSSFRGEKGSICSSS
jgi:hypothetical protein